MKYRNSKCILTEVSHRESKNDSFLQKKCKPYLEQLNWEAGRIKKCKKNQWFFFRNHRLRKNSFLFSFHCLDFFLLFRIILRVCFDWIFMWRFRPFSIALFALSCCFRFFASATFCWWLPGTGFGERASRSWDKTVPGRRRSK